MPPTRDPAAARAVALERQIRELRSAMTAAARRKDAVELAAVRARLRAVEREWAAALDEQVSKTPKTPKTPNERGPRPARPSAPSRTASSGGGTPDRSGPDRSGPGDRGGSPDRGASAERSSTGDRAGIPVRDQVRQSLSILGAPAPPRLIATVHDAFFGAALLPRRFSNIRRDEARSFAKAANARPFYICAVLSADDLSAVRGLHALSGWELERRVVGPLSPRVDFLTHAIGIAERVRQTRRPSSASLRLLQRFAQNIPGATSDFAQLDPQTVIRSAQSELEVHAGSDRASRRAAASRARQHLDDARQLFG